LWLLQMLSRQFEAASKFESKQYFDLLIELIEEQFQANAQANFDPKELLS